MSDIHTCVHDAIICSAVYVGGIEFKSQNLSLYYLCKNTIDCKSSARRLLVY